MHFDSFTALKMHLVTTNFQHFWWTFSFKGVHSIDRWRQMPPGKSWDSAKYKTVGKRILSTTAQIYL